MNEMANKDHRFFLTPFSVKVFGDTFIHSLQDDSGNTFSCKAMFEITLTLDHDFIILAITIGNFR